MPSMLDEPELRESAMGGQVAPLAVPPLGPASKAARLRTLESCGLLQTPPEPDFDHFASITASLLGFPVGLVNLVGEDQVTVKGRAGLDVETAPRDVVFCSHTLLAGTILTVPDLAQDSRFADNPLVREAPRFRFYAGAPLVSPRDSHRIGALRVIGYEPRPALAEREARLLQAPASLVMDRMELPRLEKAVRDSRAQSERMSAAAPGAGVCADSDGVITHWNVAAERLFGWSVAEAVGQSLELIVPHELRPAHTAGMSHRARTGSSAFPGRVAELPALRRDGTTFPAHISLSRWQEGDRLVFGATIHDITERRAVEEKLRYLAHYDPLTGVANRARLTEMMDEAAASGRWVGLVLLDLDGFKHVNDVLGHGAGDVLLADVGQRLAGAVPSGGTVARRGETSSRCCCRVAPTPLPRRARPGCCRQASSSRSLSARAASMSEPARG